jgi:hypothetical protein
MEDNPEVQERVAQHMWDVLNRMTKWRGWFTAWQLGTTVKGEAESEAIRDINEQRLIMRAEISALAGLLVQKGVFTQLEWVQQLTIEAEALDKMLSERFPGITSSVDGLIYKLPEAAQTMKKLNFKP